MVRPANPSTAGSSVTDATITSATVTDVPTASPRTNLTPIRNRPKSEITTVHPGEEHRAPGGVDREHDRGLGIESVVETLAVARHDEERVVDADTDPDHRRELAS